MTSSRDAMTKCGHAFCELEIETICFVKENPRARIPAHAARWLDGAGHRSRARDRARGDGWLRRKESEGARRPGAGHRERIQEGEGRGIRGAGEARGRVGPRTF